MKSVVIGSTVHSNGNSDFSLDHPRVTGINVMKDLDKVYTWINLEEDGEERSITADVFFKNYTDVLPFFKVGFTYKNENNSLARFEIVELHKSDRPMRGKGLYAVAKRHDSTNTYSYIVLDESNFSFMVQV